MSSNALRVEAVEEEENGQYLTFQAAAETFAIPIEHIKEIIEYGAVTPVPMMPAFISGVINLRGCVVPVIDLSARFGKAVSRVSRRTCIVIVEMGGEGERQDVGAVVDSVNEVLEVAVGDIEPAPSFGARIRSDFIQGMAKVEGRFVIILDADRVLDLDEMAQLREVAAEAAEPGA